MKLINIKYLATTLFVLIYFTSAFAQRGQKKADTETNEWRYEVEKISSISEGVYELKIWTYSKNLTTATLQSQKNAVHAVMFKGGPGGQKPMIINSNTKQDEFFKEFFKDGGKFQKYVFLANNGEIRPSDCIKISKKEYKIGVVVSVSTTSLRIYLEQEGILKSLSSGF